MSKKQTGKKSRQRLALYVLMLASHPDNDVLLTDQGTDGRNILALYYTVNFDLPDNENGTINRRAWYLPVNGRRIYPATQILQFTTDNNQLFSGSDNNGRNGYGRNSDNWSPNGSRGWFLIINGNTGNWPQTTTRPAITGRSNWYSSLNGRRTYSATQILAFNTDNDQFSSGSGNNYGSNSDNWSPNGSRGWFLSINGTTGNWPQTTTRPAITGRSNWYSSLNGRRTYSATQILAFNTDNDQFSSGSGNNYGRNSDNWSPNGSRGWFLSINGTTGNWPQTTTRPAITGRSNWYSSLNGRRTYSATQILAFNTDNDQFSSGSGNNYGSNSDNWSPNGSRGWFLSINGTTGNWPQTTTRPAITGRSNWYSSLNGRRTYSATQILAFNTDNDQFSSGSGNNYGSNSDNWSPNGSRGWFLIINGNTGNWPQTTTRPAITGRSNWYSSLNGRRTYSATQILAFNTDNDQFSSGSGNNYGRNSDNWSPNGSRGWFLSINGTTGNWPQTTTRPAITGRSNWYSSLNGRRTYSATQILAFNTDNDQFSSGSGNNYGSNSDNWSPNGSRGWFLSINGTTGNWPQTTTRPAITGRSNWYSSLNGRRTYSATQILAFNTDNDQFSSGSGNNYGSNSDNWSPNGSRGWFLIINGNTGNWPQTTTRPAITGRSNWYSSLNGRRTYSATQILAFNTDNDQFSSGSGNNYGRNSDNWSPNGSRGWFLSINGTTGNWPQTTTRPAITGRSNWYSSLKTTISNWYSSLNGRRTYSATQILAFNTDNDQFSSGSGNNYGSNSDNWSPNGSRGWFLIINGNTGNWPQTTTRPAITGRSNWYSSLNGRRTYSATQILAFNTDNDQFSSGSGNNYGSNSDNWSPNGSRGWFLIINGNTGNWPQTTTRPAITGRSNWYSSLNGRRTYSATQILAFNTDNDQFSSGSGNNYGSNSDNWSPNGSRGWFLSINGTTGNWPQTTTRPAITGRSNWYSSLNGRRTYSATQILAFNTDNDQFSSGSGNNYGSNSDNWSPNGSRGWFLIINGNTGNWPQTTTRPAITGRSNWYSSLNSSPFNRDNDQFFSGSGNNGSNGYRRNGGNWSTNGSRGWFPSINGNTGNWPLTTTRPAIMGSNNSNNNWGDFQSANLPPVSPTGSLPSTSHWVLPGNHPDSHYPNNGPMGNDNNGQQMPGSSPGSSPSSSSFDNMYH